MAIAAILTLWAGYEDVSMDPRTIGALLAAMFAYGALNKAYNNLEADND